MHTSEKLYFKNVPSLVMALIAAIMLCAGTAYGDTPQLSSEKYRYILIPELPRENININLICSDIFMGVEFTLTLPDGVSFVGDGLKLGEIFGPAFSIRKNETSPGRWRVLCLSPDNATFPVTAAKYARMAFSMTLTCTEAFDKGEILVSDIIFSKEHQDVKTDDIKVRLSKSNLTFALSDSHIEMKRGEHLQLHVISDVDLTDFPTLVWTSSDPAVVTVDASGLLTAIGPGSADIQVSCAHYSATCKVTVEGISATEVNVNPASAELTIGETLQMTAEVLPENTTDKTVEWHSSDMEAATVDHNGLVTAIGVGTTIITGKCGSVYGQCTVTVDAPVVPLEKITVIPATAHIIAGDRLQLTAEIFPANATDRNVTWSSSDNSVVKVDNNGIITGIGSGQATVTANCGSLSGRCAVTVTVEAESIILNTESARLPVGRTYQLTAEVYPSTTTDKTITWTSSDTGIATVDETGLVSALAMGETTVTATCGRVGARCTVTVTEQIIEATDIIITPESADMTIGETLQLNAEVLPANTTDKFVYWYSDKPSIASVDSYSGEVTATGVGSTNIYASCGSARAVAKINVSSGANEPAELYFLEPALTLKEGGSNVYAMYYVSPSDLVDKLEISVSDPSIISVYKGSVMGWAHSLIIYAHQSGQAEVTLSCGSKSATLTVTVIPYIITNYLESISFGRSSIELTEGETQQLQITTTPDNATFKILKVESMDPEIATIDSNYRLTAVKQGSTTITATALDGSGVSAELNVRVNEFLEVKAESITVKPERLSMTPGSTATLKATVLPTNTTDKSVIWSSDNTSVAIIDIYGKVTAIAEGTATLSATTADSSDLTAECMVEVAETTVSTNTATFNFNVPTTLDPVPEVSTDKATYSMAGVTFTSDNISVVANTGGKETAPRLWSCNTSGHGIEFRVYNGSSITVRSLSEYVLIKKIEFIGALLNTIEPNANGSTTSYIWENSSGQISMTFPIKTKGNNKRADITAINVTYESMTGIDAIPSDSRDANIEYYNLNGVRVESDNITPGIYIRRQGTEVTKVAIR